MTAYDRGYASVKPEVSNRVWGLATIILHLGWADAQVRAQPRDPFRWGRQDALDDLLSAFVEVRR